MLRVRRFTRFRIEPELYRDARPVEISAWTVGGEPVPFAHALTQRFEPFELGTAWGQPWDTVWFDVRGEVPAEWDPAETELVVDLGFTGDQPGFQAEGTVYRPDGSIVKALEPLNAWVPMPEAGPFRLLIEAAANPIVQVPYEYEPTLLGDKATAGDAPQYRLRALAIARRDLVVWELLQDVATLDGLVDVLPPEGSRRAEIVHALERMVDSMDPDDVPGTALLGREILAPVLASGAPDSALVVSAIGHAHIDCAWLWPTRETVRKVARTFANVLDLAERNPDFIFAASSAQQYAWLKETQPELFERVRAAVKAGSIRPVGGMWVESDTNMPGGEALVRQFVQGKRFFREEFGVDSTVGWLPDSFGYSGALPQIVRAAGMPYFLTQKPSWNEINQMPHSSFLWEGIDGSRLFTHFPPAETYNSDLGAPDLARTERKFRQKGEARQVLGLFGWGDGGGGPTREMLGAAVRKRDLDGSPRVRLGDPETFFAAASAELADPPVWTGEMYLELHRGTLISQARSKRGNRHSEALLRQAELWAATAAIRDGAAYPYDVLERAWRTVLLLQFHDILPGTSIAWVHQEAEQKYAELATQVTTLIEDSLTTLAGSGDEVLSANAAPLAQHGVPAMGIAAAVAPRVAAPSATGDRFVLEDDALRVEIDRRGTLVSVLDRVAGRELLPRGVAGGVLQLFRDTPREWDAWDINDEDKRSGRDLVEPAAIGIDGDAVSVRYELGASVVDVTIRLADGRLDYAFDIDWHESQKLLKLAFPLDLRAGHAVSEIQFGHLRRPIHQNTSWDAARFETVAHRWIQVGEPGYGVAIANDVVYGHDIRSAQAPDGRPMTTARLSLLRAPRYPDPAADQGRHAFTVSLRPGGIPEAIADGYAQHLPVREVRGTAVQPLLEVSDDAIVIESVKLAEDRSGDLVVRLYEAHGDRSSTSVRTNFGWADVSATDLLEDRAPSEAIVESTAGASVDLRLRPFEILTLRFAAPVA
ncbi:alpha-mannosidase [Agromyces aerolatus]|uniref:alpha-mannosidase n=1 Tax=Agromyces sp. LY-1074 TaxID=3074080 RepID=UPI002859F39D|nr:MULTISPECIES: glycoside hydrolase family 38 C-terminal domain-containing protein [unclassified Agromyces]MDR5700806.1 glycoside hydrolase family 38 C-terminal domain-containing protein [Agromyces sp. LY-1074]MDR5707327.1 glycoside hydrolase family 38 C-terminal domain-containing protein [Agromyces sp. LY-1358]